MTGCSSYKNRIYQAAVLQRLRITALNNDNLHFEDTVLLGCFVGSSPSSSSLFFSINPITDTYQENVEI